MLPGARLGHDAFFTHAFRQQGLPPISIEEQIICYADKFYSKNGKTGVDEKSVEDILSALRRYGPEKAARFQSWMRLFEHQ